MKCYAPSYQPMNPPSTFFLFSIISGDAMTVLLVFFLFFRHQIFLSVYGIPSTEERLGSFLRREKCTKLSEYFVGQSLGNRFVNFHQNRHLIIWCLCFVSKTKHSWEHCVPVIFWPLASDAKFAMPTDVTFIVLRTAKYLRAQEGRSMSVIGYFVLGQPETLHPQHWRCCCCCYVA